MKNKKWIRYVESFIILPALTLSAGPAGTFGAVSQAVINIVNTPSVALSEKQNNASDREKLLEEEVRLQKAQAIDKYFGERDMPLRGTGLKMVLEAEKNNIDWRLLPAIAVRESTGGKFACKKAKNSAFGWGSCKINFNSHEEAIEVVAHNLGGNNPNTARHYDEKTTKEILRAYNPPSIVPRYAEQVISIMNAIGPEEIIPTSALVVNS